MKWWIIILVLATTCIDINAENAVFENDKYCFSFFQLSGFEINDESPDGAGVKFILRNDRVGEENICECISVFAEYITSEVVDANIDFDELYISKGYIRIGVKELIFNKITWHVNIFKDPASQKTVSIYSFNSKHNLPEIGYRIIAESSNKSTINDAVEKILRSWTYSDPCNKR